MRMNSLKAIVKTALWGAAVLLFGTSAATAQINLTAGPATATLPNGSAVPMWGYSCGNASDPNNAEITCAALNAGSGWSPVLITVPSGKDLQINLTNNLTFAGGNIPTSLVIVGQLGGGLGDVTQRTTTASPDHSAAQATVTWPTAGGAGVTAPNQGPRVQSFATEVVVGTPQKLTWTNPRPGTYLIESGTHPSIQGPMGLYGILVVTTPAGTGTTGTAYPAVGTKSAAVTYDAEVPMLFSEIDPAQNNAVAAAVNNPSFSETMVWSGLPGGCGNPSTVGGLTPYGACYPPAVNYSPLYYMINGVAFDKTNASQSLFASSPAAGVSPTGNVLVRLVNAGLRMHVPSIVGAQTGTAGGGGFSLIAEDGNRLPGTTRVQNEVFMAAGKTYDVMINVPAAASAALPVFDRQLSLSGNSTARDAGMLAYISVNGAQLPSAGSLGAAVARDDTYNSVLACPTGSSSCIPVTVSDPGKGLIANDTNVYGVTVLAGPAGGALTLNPDGTFVYTPSSGTSTDSFTYCANGTVTAAGCSSGKTAKVTLGACDSTSGCLEAQGGITMGNANYTSNVATHLKIAPSGILQFDADKAGYALTVDTTTVTAASSSGIFGIAACAAPPAAPAPPCVAVHAEGGFEAYVTGSGTYSFTYKAKNSQGTQSASSATVTMTFMPPSNLAVNVLDGADKTTQITDYRWTIEEDLTFFVDPACTTTPLPASCPTVTSQGAPAVFGTNFHTSHMPLVATGCTGPLSCEGGQSIQSGTVVCDQGNGVCRPDPSGKGLNQINPSQVHLDPKRRYYISIFPGDAAQPFIAGYAGAPASCSTTVATPGNTSGKDSGNCGHGMGGAPVAKGQTTVTVLTQPSPYPPATLSVFVFEDDYPLNGEHDAGGGIDVLSPDEPGLGGFQITLYDNAGGTGDSTGTPTYDMFNQPLSNSLAGTIDPATTFDACPISKSSGVGISTKTGQSGSPSASGITGMIITCPKYESDGKTLSPLAGQAIVKNLYPGRYGVEAHPGADRIATGEEWLQTNTLDGQKAHDSFMRIGEPGYFQEFGPAGFHVTIGFANPKFINDRRAALCTAANSCNNEVKGRVSTGRMSRTPDERLYGSGSHDSYAFTQCYASLGDPDGEDFAFVKCDGDGNFDFTGIPSGNYKVTLFDQWNDQVVDGIATPVGLSGSSFLANTASGGTGYTSAPAVTVSAPPCTINTTTCIQAVAVATVSNGAVTAVTFTKSGAGYTSVPTITIAPPPTAPGNTTATASAAIGIDMGEVAVHQWQADFFSRTFLDLNGNGISDNDAAGNPEPGLALVKTNVRFRDGSFSNRNNTDLNGYAAFNEEFPLFNWYVIETDNTRYKNTGTHVVYDAGGPTDGTTGGGNSTIGKFFTNTVEQYSVPTSLRVPGAVYCDNADCNGFSIANGPATSAASNCTISGGTATCTTPTLSTGRIDPPWVQTEGWQGFSGQNNFLEFGKKPYIAGENGGIHGHVIYSSTRPFDDPQFGTQNVWEPLVPGVTINLYREDFATDGVTPTLKLVDTTKTSSWDDWAQGFRSDGIPNMNCPGQSTTDPFFLGLQNQPNYLDWYNSQHGGSGPTALPASSQFKCYDGMHNWNQLQPAPYDGMYQFPSVLALDPVKGTPMGTNCTICVKNPDASDPYRSGTPMLPAGKYVTEVVVPPGYELVKEEDKNILIGDNFIAPVVQEIGGLGDVFILPDQAEINSVCNTTSSFQNPTCSLGRNQGLESHEGDTPTVDTFWPCVGASRTVPDYISLFPQSKQVAPFAGATRNLCDRKEVTLADQTSSQAEFFLWTPTHIASKFTGLITDDFDAEFDPFSPQFGEKFAPAYLPVSIKDWAGNEISRVYSDEWGAYNGLSYSTWEVNPPNPTGYAPTMMVTCMNDPGSGVTPDPFFQPGYSNFCYELPFMPGATGYFDTPVVPTSAFAGGYNHPDCAYPDATPAISEVDGDGVGPWVSAAGKTLTIKTINYSGGQGGTNPGDQLVENYGYSGPAAPANAAYNQQKVARHYGFGTQCKIPTAGSATCNTLSTVTIGTDASGKPIPATITQWNDTQIQVTVPSVTGNSAVQPCSVQQQKQYAKDSAGKAYGTAYCGELVITAGNGKPSVDTVTVTIGGKQPNPWVAGQTIQHAIDTAQPGDLIMVPPGTYQEMLIMWKPVRLQGVGAASAVIDANPHPAGRLDPWRRQIVCTFGLALNGTPINTNKDSKGNPINPYDPTGASSCSAPMQFSVDRLPLEATVGWDASLNGNLAEQLIEPSLLGAYEGAGITVLGKGVRFGTVKNPITDPKVIWASDVFPTGTALLTTGDCGSDTTTATNPFPSNFWCNPSRIDGLSVVNSSQGGGGILVHGWAHNLEISNNRVHSNQGTLSGGITVGQGEHPDANLGRQTPTTIPGSCESGVLNQALPFCFDMHVDLHNNAVTLNSSLGDELFSSTPAGAGGVSICNGSDYYKFHYNWVCGNMSTGDGAGVAHLGFTKNGDIEHNAILFNQSTNPSITTNGGGLLVMGAPDADPPCGITTDKDCLSAPNTITPSDGTGPGLVINANLIMGNSADSGSGGGLRLQHINGNDVISFPDGAHACANPGTPSCLWNSVSVTNNIISNNVAGWDGGGVSLQDALAVNIVNNTIVSNDSTASAGPLFGSLFAPLASTPVDPTSTGVNCTTATLEQSCPQVAGLVSITNSPVLVANLPTGVTCPAGHGTSGSCAKYSVPLLANNIIWDNRSFVIGLPGFGTGTTNQQKTVALYNAALNGQSAPTLATTQTATGGCPTGSSYWDIGVRGDTGPSNHNGGLLSPAYSVLTDAADYSTGNNLGSDPTLVSKYCNGSRVPPEAGVSGFMVTPGTNEVNALPTPVFTLSPSATVDEGNNWVNLRWGPLASTNPATNAILGNYELAAGSPAIDYIPTSVAHPATDFFGNTRPDPNVANRFDVGAIEFQGANPAPVLTSIAPNTGRRSSVVSVTLTGTHLTGTTAVTVSGTGVGVSGVTVVNDTQVTATFTITATAGLSARNVTVTTSGGTSNQVTFTVAAPTLTLINPATGVRGTSVPVTLTGTGLTGATAVNVSGTGNGITVNNLVVVSDTQITATFVIAPTAPVSAGRTVTVTTPGGATGGVLFAVTAPAAPRLTSISPNAGARGATVAVTLTGTNLTGATGVTVSGSGVTVSGITVVSDTQVTATFTITTGATLSARNVSVTTLGGTSNTTTFTVQGATLASITPTAGTQNTTVPITLTGTNLTGTTAVAMSGSGVNCTVTGTPTATSVAASCAITNGAARTLRTVTATTPIGTTTGTVTFTVN